jgi:hypothetical protein
MKFTQACSETTAVTSYGLPERMAGSAISSPTSATFKMISFPSTEEVEILTRPLHTAKIPRAGWPSINKIGPLG